MAYTSPPLTSPSKSHNMSQFGGLSSQPQLQQQGWYPVYRPEFDTAAFGALDPVKRYHEGVFVELDATTHKGTLFHVTGDIISANGMYYEERKDYAPSLSEHLFRNTQIGWVRKDDIHSGKITAILRGLPTPPRQQGLDFWDKEKDPVTKQTKIIWMRQDGERYGPGEQRRPVFKCNEWIHQYAIPALRAAGVLHDSI
ncbi:hypothetical protein FQN50_007944 [Emmonsiellopsis sp. PD_5]|nr:hypothetical protein FQN50_007944 [Emmonsiellopsis sp. PD_5]